LFIETKKRQQADTKNNFELLFISTTTYIGSKKEIYGLNNRM